MIQKKEPIFSHSVNYLVFATSDRVNQGISYDIKLSHVFTKDTYFAKAKRINSYLCQNICFRS